MERFKTGQTSADDTCSCDHQLLNIQVKEQLDQCVKGDPRIGQKSSGNAEVK
jgi:hypothetical protein